MEKEIKENYNLLDILKFVCSILVICIHTHPFKSFSENLDFWHINMLCRIAVPVFFISSGYFFYKKINEKGHQFYLLKNYLKRLVTIYLIWSLIYFPISNGFHHISSQNIINLFSGLFINGIYNHLWFFPALIFSIILLYFLSQKLSLKVILFGFFIIYLIGLLGDSYYHLTEYIKVKALIDLYRKYFIYTRNGLFFGMVYVSLGAYFTRVNINRFKTKWLNKGLISAFLLFIIEVYLIKTFKLADDYNMYISLFPLTYFLFLIVLKSQLFISIKAIAFREYSTLIYLFHLIPVYLTRVFAFKEIIPKPDNLVIFIYSLISSLMFAYIFRIISNKMSSNKT